VVVLREKHFTATGFQQAYHALRVAAGETPQWPDIRGHALDLLRERAVADIEVPFGDAAATAEIGREDRRWSRGRHRCLYVVSCGRRCRRLAELISPKPPEGLRWVESRHPGQR
jgi:hypothetical protein